MVDASANSQVLPSGFALATAFAPISPFAVLDDDRFLRLLGDRLRRDPGERVERAAGRKRHDGLHGRLRMGADRNAGNNQGCNGLHVPPKENAPVTHAPGAFVLLRHCRRSSR